MREHSTFDNNLQALRLHKRLTSKAVVILVLMISLVLATLIIASLLLLGIVSITSSVESLVEEATDFARRVGRWIIVVIFIILLIMVIHRLVRFTSRASKASSKITAGSDYYQRNLDNDIIRELGAVIEGDASQVSGSSFPSFYVFGPSGVGKTKMLQSLRERMKNAALEHRRTFVMPYCELMEGDTAGRIARQLFIELDSIGAPTKNCQSYRAQMGLSEWVSDSGYELADRLIDVVAAPYPMEVAAGGLVHEAMQTVFGKIELAENELLSRHAMTAGEQSIEVELLDALLEDLSAWRDSRGSAGAIFLIDNVDVIHPSVQTESSRSLALAVARIARTMPLVIAGQSETSPIEASRTYKLDLMNRLEGRAYLNQVGVTNEEQIDALLKASTIDGGRHEEDEPCILPVYLAQSQQLLSHTHDVKVLRDDMTIKKDERFSKGLTAEQRTIATIAACHGRWTNRMLEDLPLVSPNVDIGFLAQLTYVNSTGVPGEYEMHETPQRAFAAAGEDVAIQLANYYDEQASSAQKKLDAKTWDRLARAIASYTQELSILRNASGDSPSIESKMVEVRSRLIRETIKSRGRDLVFRAFDYASENVDYWKNRVDRDKVVDIPALNNLCEAKLDSAAVLSQLYLMTGDISYHGKARELEKEVIQSYRDNPNMDRSYPIDSAKALNAYGVSMLRTRRCTNARKYINQAIDKCCHLSDSDDVRDALFQYRRNIAAAHLQELMLCEERGGFERRLARLKKECLEQYANLTKEYPERPGMQGFTEGHFVMLSYYAEALFRVGKRTDSLRRFGKLWEYAHGQQPAAYLLECGYMYARAMFANGRDKGDLAQIEQSYEIAQAVMDDQVKELGFSHVETEKTRRLIERLDAFFDRGDSLQ